METCPAAKTETDLTSAMKKEDIKSFEYERLKDLVARMGEKSFRADQIFKWIHRDHASSFDEMTNLSKELRRRLDEEFEIRDVKEVRRLRSGLDGTTKFLFELADGNVIESVLLRYGHGNSVCVSTQAGCRMGCAFCASAIGGLSRNLTASEILSQVYKIEDITGERVSNVVLMGSGEPFDNYESVTAFIRLLSDDRGRNLSARNITVSTCGIVPGIRRLADEGLPVTLAVSLHASDDKKRRELMPVANAYSLASLIGACAYYREKTGRRVTFEYSLIRGVNDSREDAERLCALLKGLNCHVNLIALNPVKEKGLHAPASGEVARFKNNIEKNGINVTIRREMGRDIDGACGQLRRGYIRENQEGG